MPPLSERIKNYLAEKKLWEEAGCPTRSKDRIAEIYQICKKCPNLLNTLSFERCEICGCNINLGYVMNKLAWSTIEECPDNPPRWVDRMEQKKGIQTKTEKEKDIKSNQIIMDTPCCNK